MSASGPSTRPPGPRRATWSARLRLMAAVLALAAGIAALVIAIVLVHGTLA